MRALVLASVAACSDPFTFHATMRWEGSGPGVIRVNGVAIETSAVERNYGFVDETDTWALNAASGELFLDALSGACTSPSSTCTWTP